MSRFDLTVAPGEIVGLIGPNGAGKTTVFHVVAGFYPPTEGAIAFEGTSLVGLKPHAICRLGLARTFQLVQPFAGLTTLENVMVGAFNRAPDVGAARRRAAEIVEFVGLGPRVHAGARVGDEAADRGPDLAQRALGGAVRRQLDVAPVRERRLDAPAHERQDALDVGLQLAV